MFLVKQPFEQFFDLSGAPLNAGYVYLGAVGSNPEASPMTVYWDAAGLIPAAQPLRTLNGFIVRNGSPAKVYTAANYTMTVRDVNKNLIFSTEGDLETSFVGVVDDITALKAIAPTTGTIYFVKEHTAGTPGGSGYFRGYTGSPPGTYTDDNGITVRPTGGDGSTAWVRVYEKGRLNATWYGTDFANVFGAAQDGNEVYFPAGTYTFTSEIVTTKALSIVGDGSEGTHLVFDGCDGVDFQLGAQETENLVVVENLSMITNALGVSRCIKHTGPASTGDNGIRFRTSNVNFVGSDWEAGTGTAMEWKTAILLSQSDGALVENCWDRGKATAYTDAFDTATAFIDAASVTHLNVSNCWGERLKWGVKVSGQSESVVINNDSAMVAVDIGVLGSSLTQPSNHWVIESSHFACHTLGVDIQQVAAVTEGAKAVTIKNNFFIKREDGGGVAGYRGIKVFADGPVIVGNQFNSGGTISPITSGDAAIEIAGGQFGHVSGNYGFNSGILVWVKTGTSSTTVTDNKAATLTEVSIPLFDEGATTINFNNTQEQAKSVRANTAQAGAASTITLDAGASAVDNYYRGMWIHTTGGTGAGQTRFISSYVGSTKVATVSQAWGVNPDATTTFRVEMFGEVGAQVYASLQHDFFTQGGNGFSVVNGGNAIDTKIEVVGSTLANGYAIVRAVPIAGLTAGNTVDLALQPGNGGRLRFWTAHAAITTETLSGYIEFKDNTGTVRKLGVVS